MSSPFVNRERDCFLSNFMVSLSVRKALFCKCSGHASLLRITLCRVRRKFNFLSSSWWFECYTSATWRRSPLWIFWILFFPHWTFWLQSSSVSSMWHGWFRGTSFGTSLGQNTIQKNKMARKMTAHSSYTLAVIFSRKMCCWRGKLTTVWAASFFIFIIDVSTQIVKPHSVNCTAQNAA